MLIKLHSQATTAPKIRATIQASKEPAWMVAEEVDQWLASWGTEDELPTPECHK